MLAWCGHDLKEHLINSAKLAALDEEALKLVASLAEERLRVKLDTELFKREVKSVVKKLASALGIGVDLARRAVALAAGLHDVGKALSVYQRELERAQASARGCRASLRGHEVWSAWVARHVASSWLSVGGSGGDLAAVIAAAVALHHSARRGFDDVLVDALGARPELGDVDRMFALAKEVADAVGVEFYVAGALAVAEYEWKQQSAIENLRSFLLRPAAVWGELVTHVISLVDNLDSATARDDSHLVYVLRPFTTEL
jgi:CRISPR-associated endonuclease Cas3-HD